MYARVCVRVCVRVCSAVRLIFRRDHLEDNRKRAKGKRLRIGQVSHLFIHLVTISQELIGLMKEAKHQPSAWHTVGV